MHYTLWDCLLDLFQNSVEADSSKINLNIIQSKKELEVLLLDNGKGMDKETLNKVKDPFYTDGIKHKKRKVGLGIPFLIQTIEMTGGQFSLESELGVGTKFSIVFNLEHWDTPPLGNIVDMIVSAMTFSGDYELIVNRTNTERGSDYQLIRSELRDTLGDLNDVTNMILLKEFIASGEIED